MTGGAPDISAYEPALAAIAWRAGRLEWKLWPQQEPIYYGIRGLDSPVEEIVVLCARQFGKSHLGVLMALEDCLRFPDRCILIVGPTLKQTRDIVTPRMNQIRRDAPPGLIRPSKSEGKWYVGNSELVIGGFDQNSSAQRGKTVQTIYIEEVVDSNPDDYTESMRSDLGPALTHSDRGKMIFLTTLPKIPDHPFIIDTMARAEMNGVLYSYTIDDNKALSAEQYDACVRRAGGRHTIDFRREYLNEIIRDPTIVVVPDFDPARHVRPVLPARGANVQVTIDFGGVRDLTVALLHWYDFQADKVCFGDERWFPSNTSTEAIMRDLRAMEAGVPEGSAVTSRVADLPGQLQVDLLAAHDYLVTPPPKDDWQAAINNLALGFTTDRVVVDPKCRLLVQTLKSGTFNRNRTDFERTQSLGHCDAIAAAMYGYRTQDRANPWQRHRPGGDWTWSPPSPPSPEADLGAAVQPRSFPTVPGSGTFVGKRFGKFK